MLYSVFGVDGGGSVTGGGEEQTGTVACSPGAFDLCRVTGSDPGGGAFNEYDGCANAIGGSGKRTDRDWVFGIVTLVGDKNLSRRDYPITGGVGVGG